MSQQAYTTIEPGNPVGLLAEALALSEELAPLEKRLRQARKEGLIEAEYLGHQIEQAESAQVISKDEATRLRNYHEKLTALMAVDDFAAEEIGRAGAAAGSDSAAEDEARQPAARSAAKSKATARKRSSVAKKKASVPEQD